MWNHSRLASEFPAWRAQTMNFLPPIPREASPVCCWMNPMNPVAPGPAIPIFLAFQTKNNGSEQLSPNFQALWWCFSGIYFYSLRLWGFHPLGPPSWGLPIFLFPRAHASGGTRETGKTQEECNNLEIYEISEVQCARKHVRLWLGQTVEIWQLFYCYNSSKILQCVYSSIILLYIKYIFQRKHFFFPQNACGKIIAFSCKSKFGARDREGKGRIMIKWFSS